MLYKDKINKFIVFIMGQIWDIKNKNKSLK